MSKELPYFRFTASEWLSDDISLEEYDVKGVFVDVCAYYWFKDCSITLALLEKRFSNAKAMLKQLFKSGILKVDDSGENVTINFLDEQFYNLSESRKRRQVAGSKGGKQSLSNAKAKLKQSRSRIDRLDRDKNRDINTYKYSIFYDSEITLSEKNEDYIKVIDILFGKNNLGINLNSVLSMELQLSFAQFQKLLYLKNKYKFSITEILEEMENWKDLKKRKSVYKTFLTFLKNKNPNVEIK